MAVDPGLGPAGGAVYSADSMHIGDGTWDSTRNSFLLPNIQGLNFDTMRYNGMGNRFKALVQYHQLISAHGIIAAITFLGIVPAAILIASFYHQNPALGLRIHISLQIMTVILSTVVLILGYFAVGPERSLTNPHHGIGVAIYVLILIQAIGGALIRKIEKGKVRYHIPIKLMLHQWFGRGIALLAIAQIPIGLTLYGSPLWLFVVYTIIMAAYVLLYFILSYEQHKRAAGYDDRGSYVTGTELTGDSGRPAHRGRLGALAGAAAGAVGIAALKRKFSNRDSRRPPHSAGHSRIESESYVTEKYDESDAGSRDHTWRNRFLGAGAGLGAAALLKKAFGRKSDNIRDDGTDSQVTTYRPPLGGPIAPSAEHLDRIEQGLPMTDDERWRQTEERERRQAAAMQRPQQTFQSELSGDSIGEYSDGGDHRFKAKHSGPGIGAGLAGLATVVGLGGWLERRRSKKEEERVAAQKLREREEERLYRPNEGEPLYPGDGTPRRDGVRFDPNLPGNSPYNQHGGILPVPPLPPMQHTSSPGPPRPPGIAVQPGPDPFISGNPYGPPPPQMGPPFATQGPPQHLPPPPQGQGRSRPAIPMPIPIPMPMGGHDLPPPRPPMHNDQSSMSGSPYNSSIRRGPPRSNLQPPLPVASPPQNRSSADPYSDSNMQSPAISVKVKTHNDGRHVTLRRLNEEEAAAEREARRRPRQARRDDSFGSPTTMQSPTSQQRAGSAQRMGAGTPSGLGQQHPSDLHLPPAQHGQMAEMSAVGSSPMTGATGGAESYDTNRRRRRAERSRDQRPGQRVEFE